ncbi:ThiF family adenylyltransferase [Chitinophaga sp. LS1]|uniref:HesA/MoeB/ThiF family protein n=1 Tax=Chitinophaga sp. LS1 TaxID=3051176 RepID=UPI002AAB61AD|nr:ThiF family adenylyltransferase [Chitinophaga sp. LS1]WPV67509.1 ThiF family adenylyltransferase [Chitinophaga sp. LS1]
MIKLRLTGGQHAALVNHLYPGDNKEAVALGLCSRSFTSEGHTLCLKEIHPIPHDKCFQREEDYVHWPTDMLKPLLEVAEKHNYAILKIHCHPGGGEFFSHIDTKSDRELFSGIHQWLDTNLPHVSCIMLPDGRIFGRAFDRDLNEQRIQQISVAGANIYQWHYQPVEGLNEALQARNLQAFGKGTMLMLSRMKIGVVGCSGTGSIVIEQLKRYGVGSFVLVDPDTIDFVNLNRIIGSTHSDAEMKVLKTSVMKREIEEVGFKTTITVYPSHISEANVVKDLADCDILFGCVDGAEGRHILNLISSCYLIPYFDLGVRLDADGVGGISGIYGTVHYIQPGGSSLLSRGAYSVGKLLAETTKRQNAEAYARNQYLAAVGESSPAVITVNMKAAATAVEDFLARIHPYRIIPNSEIDAIRIIFATSETTTVNYKDKSCEFFDKYVGIGDVKPLLRIDELGRD